MDLHSITGLVLAGGQGTRMGGLDKGLQSYRGQPLAQHALQRLQPQVGSLLLSANRHLDAYAAFGVPVWPDADSDFAGPLAGLLAGLNHCTTPYLASVPCDAPLFPTDLVARLAAARSAADADIAMASAPDTHGVQRTQPVFCLLRTSLQTNLAQFLAAGGRKVGLWTALHHTVLVPFADSAAFFNANTLAELHSLDQ
ncbi:molybdenum cofactor guanylyltransferase [Rhodoferax sp. OV413]|uniref:molybdenum cofactor guanylyltransferase MobA n=1 Tax=Rhodoferax sp. OV413 TaxID=1855285 RepID=UPI0008895634|nr:molybdenum cofactor guanylyltransferase MobA [Rhodoferax sp. OV413]SDO16341.1 molybdenum cofactor guanylyltransferase [Rhodoferax sp. OV413]